MSLSSCTGWLRTRILASRYRVLPTTRGTHLTRTLSSESLKITGSGSDGTAFSAGAEHLLEMAREYHELENVPTEPLGAEEASKKNGASVYAIGRRKASSAGVSLFRGAGKITINGRPLSNYFKDFHMRKRILEPFYETDTLGVFDIQARVQGGGTTGQGDAIKLAVARALQQWDPSYRPILKKAKLLTRDARVKEEKKPGLKKARKAGAWVKR